jgi:hypothetical protein
LIVPCAIVTIVSSHSPLFLFPGDTHAPAGYHPL